MINNPMQLLSMLRNSNNPMSMIKQMAQNNPQLQPILQNIQGKNPKELEQYARNLAQSKGINLNQFLNQFGISV